MFTGIIEATAKVIENLNGSLTVERPKSFDDIKLGSSIDVAGVCLTIVELTDQHMRFDMVEETLKKSRLGKLKKGESVNLERAMSASARLDGHIVQGHVEGVADVIDLRDGRLSLELRDDPGAAIVEKGSITIDGVSLTVASLTGNRIEIALVPHTLAITTLKTLTTGDLVNIETDILARHAAKR
jgi:riboflavin synthase